MAEAKGTAQNAKMIEIQMKAAASYMEEAQKAVRIALETLASGESDTTGEMTNFITLQRMLSMGIKDAKWNAERWTENRMSREKAEKGE